MANQGLNDNKLLSRQIVKYFKILLIVSIRRKLGRFRNGLILFIQFLLNNSQLTLDLVETIENLLFNFLNGLVCNGNWLLIGFQLVRLKESLNILLIKLPVLNL